MSMYTEFDIEKMSDQEILDKLNNLGLNIDIDIFKETSSAIKLPSILAHRWSSSIHNFYYNRSTKQFETTDCADSTNKNFAKDLN